MGAPKVTVQGGGDLYGALVRNGAGRCIHSDFMLDTRVTQHLTVLVVTDVQLIAA